MYIVDLAQTPMQNVESDKNNAVELQKEKVIVDGEF